jgi:hypothetical protein
VVGAFRTSGPGTTDFQKSLYARASTVGTSTTGSPQRLKPDRLRMIYVGAIFLEYHKVQISAEWFAETFVAIGERLGFTGQHIAAPFIPGDQCLSNI